MPSQFGLWLVEWRRLLLDHRGLPIPIQHQLCVLAKHEYHRQPRPQTAFSAGGQSASALNHPNIIHIYDVSSSEGTDLISMEFISGKTLDQLIGKNGLPVKDTVNYMLVATGSASGSGSPTSLREARFNS